MKLQNIDIEGFGVLRRVRLADMDAGLSVVYGTNGSGKTTLLQFLRGVFCGFSESRRMGLLPPSAGGVGGGSLRVQSDGEVVLFSRVLDADGADGGGTADRLHVALPDLAREVPHPHFDASALRADLLPLLYAAGAAELHAVEKIVQQAQQDGVQLLRRRKRAARLTEAMRQIDRECAELLDDGDSGRLIELSTACGRLHGELERLTNDLRHRCRQFEYEAQRTPRPTGEVGRWEAHVTRLRMELAAAQSDLQEAEDRAWAPAGASIRPSAAVPPRHVHLDARRVYRLQQLDRRIDHARSLLAEAARARLEVNLRTAAIAGSEDTTAAAFLRQIRESLSSLEVGVLELRDDTQTLAAVRDTAHCVCNEQQTASREAVSELTKGLYQLCEHVSRFELQETKSLLAGAATTISDCELTLLKHLDDLRRERRSMLSASGSLREWKGPVQAKVEHEYCGCLEHEPRIDWKFSAAAAQTPFAESRQAISATQSAVERPSLDELHRLRGIIECLQDELEAATGQWRSARSRCTGFEIPEDIRALEEQLENTRIELHALDAALANGAERWRVLSVTAEVLRRLVERDQQPKVMRWASEYLRRLTGGRYVAICVGAENAIEVVACDGGSKPRSALSRGTLDQLALSLRLAVCRAYAARGVRFPLLLDDVLVETDDERLHAAARLLHDFSREHDQQIIYLTCQSHLVEVFERQGTAVRTLPGSEDCPRRRAGGAERSEWALRGWVDRKFGNEVKPLEPVSIERPEPQPAALETCTARDDPSPRQRLRSQGRSRPPVARLLKPLSRRQPDGPYWLSMNAAVDRIPSIGAQMGRRLSGLGIRTVADLVDLDVNGPSLRFASLRITSQRVRDWQAEAELLCCVPDLTGPDAQWLVGVGVHCVQQLSHADVDQLVQQIDELPEAQRSRFGGTAALNRDVIQRWIHNSRRARSLRDARRLSRKPVGMSRSGRRSAPRQRRRQGRDASDSRLPERAAAARRVRRAIRRPRRGGPDRPASALRPREQSVIATIVAAAPTAEASPDPAQRFFLSPESLVVEAPSIGPTTSRRLEKVGVLTVGDLLSRDAKDVAQRMKNRRVKEETVVLWQTQARLMCRIPMLRGHDAQVLVACGITHPEQMAAMTPGELFGVVGPFVATKEGQRLLRSSSTPDLEEVTGWVAQARHSRNLRAA